ncbi:alpha-L-rhamnosidase [Lachnospiraceae bacterium PF1-21]
MQIKELKILNTNHPLGIDCCPFFSWIMESDKQNTIQSTYEIIVRNTHSILWDTGKVKSNKSCFIQYEGMPLQSREQYSVTVVVQDNYGNEALAESWFEMTLLHPEDWTAKWAESPIPRKKGKPGFGNQDPATMFRKEITLVKRPIKARVYATCHGIYELSINGKRVSNRYFAPEHTVYEKYLCYQTYDVSSCLREGENVLGMYVGDGWYLGPQTLPNIKKLKHAHAVLFQLEVEYEDGSCQTIISDSGVKATYGPIKSSDLFAGELYDANQEVVGWDDIDFDDSGWKTCQIADYGYTNLRAQSGDSVEVIEVLPVMEVLHSKAGETILDFGQNIAGIIQMKTDAPKGTKIVLEHCEVLDREGNYINNIMSAGGVGKGCDQRDIYISNGKPSVFSPHFTYHGFRYVKVTGITVNAQDFTALVLSSRKEEIGTFETSDTRLNRLFENTRWSQRANMLSIPTDCPQREKAGWTGDMLVYSKTAMQLEDCTILFTRWLENMTADQDKYGIVPMVVPNNGNYPMTGKMINLMYGEKGQATSSGWGDAAVTVPYSMYWITGNTEILKLQYECMQKWCDYIIKTAKHKKGKKSKLPPDIEEYLWNTGYHYGEWLIPSQNKNGMDMKNLKKNMAMSSCYTAPIFGWNSIQTFANISGILAADYPNTEIYEKNQKEYQTVADRMKRAIQDGVIKKDGSMPTELMGAYVLPLFFELLSEEKQENAKAHLENIIEKNDFCMDTGFLTTPFLLDALCKVGRIDLAYQMLWQDKTPSWLSEVKAGATTIWENCFGYDAEGNPGNLSYNHYSFGCVDDWMFRNIGGIDTNTAGYKHLIFAPKPDGKLEFAKRTFKTAQGWAACEWNIVNENDGDYFNMKVKIPCNSTGTVILPDGKREEKGSGEYVFKTKI